MKQVHKIKRRISSQIFVGDVAIGGGAPISVQSMTNTNTCDIDSTVLQIESLEKAGADLVRVSIPTMDAAEAFKEIKQRANIPLITDIHFDYKIALKVAEYGADCLRINPGNIGKEDRVREVVAQQRITIYLFVLVLMLAHWKKIYRKNIQSQLLRQWWNRHSDILIF